MPPVRRSPLLLEDIRTLLAPLEFAAGSWPAGVAARRDMALLLMGFAGAHRRGELVALTLADVTLHKSDGLHVRLRSSKTDQEARGQVKALPFGRDPVTCPPCAYVRWRHILHASDTAADGAARRAVLPVLRRLADAATIGGGEGDPVAQHCCRGVRFPDPVDPDRALFPAVHKTGAIGDAGDVRGRGRGDDQAPRRPGRVHPRPNTADGGTFTAVGFRHRGLQGRRGRTRHYAANRAPLAR